MSVAALTVSKPAHETSLGHQARKALATRERILQAVVELINESGFSGATSGQIARRAGITWGAVQHHFGTKDDILLAIIERSQQVYLDQLQSAQLAKGPLSQRIDHFVDAVWEHYRSDLYFAFSEIMRASRMSAIGPSLSAFSISEEQEKHIQIMASMFADYAIPSQRLKECFRFVHRFLAGFALDRIMEPSAPYETIHIKRLKDELLQLVSDKGSDTGDYHTTGGLK
ncbi:transcriptional regulator, TetR family protein [Aequoribacter fuscus]|jgi:AcrR family transcriptional regulator|uniref:Transcriptional regulator, TetR family protein n=1 Tax=Aequoribacter fuscus TaxID=2518989 RepID=F3L4Q6_9GAMM|nr:TetR/AcrR family transcriptional regulator [Aequoribacter fuscus]EGG28704.1 transcriptional regulator, TetR family protein [Aequoribacter fuscus]QHJ89160.1 TetR/AcrR family transcriptional regulator [Aequoribacter fuscus]